MLIAIALWGTINIVVFVYGISVCLGYIHKVQKTTEANTKAIESMVMEAIVIANQIGKLSAQIESQNDLLKTLLSQQEKPARVFSRRRAEVPEEKKKKDEEEVEPLSREGCDPWMQP